VGFHLHLWGIPTPILQSQGDILWEKIRGASSKNLNARATMELLKSFNQQYPNHVKAAAALVYHELPTSHC